MVAAMKKLGIIAGGGHLPQMIAESCRDSGRPYFVLAMEDYANPAFVAAHPHCWQKLGKVGHAIDSLKENGVEALVLAGAIERPSLSALSPDFKGMKLMGRIAMLKNQGDDALLTTLMAFLEEHGFAIESAHGILSALTVPEGPLTKLSPGAEAMEDITLGREVLKALGAFDIGQGVIVQQKKIIGIEAAEGTDRLLARIAPLLLKGEKATLIKMAKPTQDNRADMPAIGPETVAHAHEAGLGGIAVEARGALVLNQPATIEAADKLGLFIVAI